MFERSVIRTSGQWLKAQLAFWGVVVGGALLIAGVMRLGGAPRTGVAMVLAGIGIVLAAALFGTLAIRCPKCRARWVWSGISGRSSNDWLAWLLSRDECPTCGYGKSDERKAA